MNKWVEEFKRLLAKDRISFVIHCLKAGFILMFLLGLVMPFAIGSANTISMSSKIMGGNFYTPVIVILFIAYVLTILMKKTKLANTIFKTSTILSLLIIIWGLIFFFVGVKPAGGDLGTGMLFMIIFNFCMWYIFVKESKVVELINKYSRTVDKQEKLVEDTSKEE